MTRSTSGRRRNIRYVTAVSFAIMALLIRIVLLQRRMLRGRQLSDYRAVRAIRPR